MVFSLDDPSITSFFETYEARERAFNRAVASLVPVRYKGPEFFWQDFQHIIQTEPSPGAMLPAFITSNPRDCLAFGSAQQVLSAAQTTVGTNGDTAMAAKRTVAERFGLQPILHQPIRTLSGGETVRLALAKAMIMAGGCDQLVVSSPFCWMSANHLPHLMRVAGQFQQLGKPVRILAMSGETSQDPIGPAELGRIPKTKLAFTLLFQETAILLGTSLNAITARPGVARVMDAEYHLSSPCLWVGDNGQGKSLVAKALCRAVAMQGEALIARPGCKGPAGLLFQDVVTQTLMRTVPVMARTARHTAGPPAQAIYDDILARQQQWISEENIASTAADHDSLLAVKAMLIAMHLSSLPSALILDEPDWGLSRSAAVAFVAAVVEKAHGLGIPVIIISHKPWWRSMAADVLEVTKETTCNQPLQLMIRLTPILHNKDGI